MPEVTLNIPQELYRRAQRIAEKRQLYVQDVLIGAIQLNDGGGRLSGMSEDDTVWREEEAFQRLHPQLLETYSGEYVAIHNGKVVDHDSDQVALYRRVSQRVPDRFVLIAKVTPQPTEEYRFRSPRLNSVR